MPSVDMLQEISAKLDSVSALLKLLSIAVPYNQGDMQAAVFRNRRHCFRASSPTLDKTIMEAVQA